MQEDISFTHTATRSRYIEVDTEQFLYLKGTRPYILHDDTIEKSAGKNYFESRIVREIIQYLVEDDEIIKENINLIEDYKDRTMKFYFSDFIYGLHFIEVNPITHPNPSEISCVTHMFCPESMNFIGALTEEKRKGLEDSVKELIE